jgi:hypothetical protein
MLFVVFDMHVSVAKPAFVLFAQLVISMALAVFIIVVRPVVPAAIVVGGINTDAHTDGRRGRGAGLGIHIATAQRRHARERDAGQ